VSYRLKIAIAAMLCLVGATVYLLTGYRWVQVALFALVPVQLYLGVKLVRERPPATY
jgi:hypothetical protein